MSIKLADGTKAYTGSEVNLTALLGVALGFFLGAVVGFLLWGLR